jgi:hypothetical protein
MAESQRGVGVVWGITTTGAAYTGSGTLRHQSQSFARSSDMEETRDELGEVINVTAYNQQQEIQLTVVPSGATMAAAKASNIVPVPGEKLTITDADVSLGGGSTKDYMVVSATMNKTNNGKATIEITAKRWAGISSYTVLAS